MEMRQYAPYPHALKELVDHLEYRPGWSFTLEDIERDPADTHGAAAGGLTLVGITGHYGEERYEGAMDAYHPNRPRPVYFYFPVPAATYDARSWRRWLFERILDVERHEAMEHFQLVYEGDFVKKDGTHTDRYVERPYSPSHGPGNDPYFIREVGTELDQMTSFRGKVNA
jgi:hypothetical protein